MFILCLVLPSSISTNHHHAQNKTGDGDINPHPSTSHNASQIEHLPILAISLVSSAHMQAIIMHN
jgi:hypothetical protein